MQQIEISPPPMPTDEDAFVAIVKMLTNPPQGYRGKYGYEVYLPHVMHQYLRDAHNVADYETARRYYQQIAPVFYSAAWDLCRRGILRPGVAEHSAQSTDDGSGGNGYSITTFGRQWIKESAGRYDYVPTEPGRFAKILDSFSPQFGEGFKERAQEAVRCYGAHAFLACCAMCGAAAESVVLAVAIAKDGDNDRVEKAYLGISGRSKLEKFILGQQVKRIQEEFSSSMNLLKYWRDNSAHGMASHIQDNEAFTSLSILLRFAQFSTSHWTTLMTPQQAIKP